MTEVRIDAADDPTTARLARVEILATILVQIATAYLAIRTIDDGTTWPTLVWRLRRLRSRLRGAIAVRVPAWPVIAEAEKIVREGVRYG